MNQIVTGYKVYLLEIIGKLINKTKCATFPYPPFFWDTLYVIVLVLVLVLLIGMELFVCTFIVLLSRLIN